MRTDSVLVREGDGKEFRTIELGHWSMIAAVDGERDWVKWYGPGYVGYKGNTYRLRDASA